MIEPISPLLPVPSLGRCPAALEPSRAPRARLKNPRFGGLWLGSFAAIVLLGAAGCSDSGPNDPIPSGAGGSNDTPVPMAGAAAGGQAGAPMGTGGTPPIMGGAGGMMGSAGAATGGAGGQAAGGTGGQPEGGSGGRAAGGTAGQATGGSGGGEPDEGWIDLFNGENLDGWVPHDGGRDNNSSLPLSEVFQVENGEIHVYPGAANGSVQRFANLRNEMSLSGNYVLQVEYRWGENKFASSTDASRATADRDAGILFHITGSDVGKVFPDSLEMQIGDSAVGGKYVTGDLWVLGVPTFVEVMANGALMEVGGEGSVAHRTGVHAENPHGEWNVCEVTVTGADEAVFMLNDVEVNHIYNFTYNNQPLDSGFVSVQAEWAEVFYRNIRYKPL